jgi:hypothetical protein
MNETPTVMNFAKKYIGAGISIIPIRRDGSKAPCVREWTPYQQRLANDLELRQWFARKQPYGIGVVCGAVSGNLETLDFDDEADVLFPAWRSLVESEAPGLIQCLSIVQTPRKPAGYHVRYRTGGIAPVTIKLAMTADGKTTLIETRGEGAYALAPGTPAVCHENKVEYLTLEGTAHAWEPPTITPEEREILLRCAASFDHRLEAEAARSAASGLRPGDDYSIRGPDWAEILIGWAGVHQRGDVRYWRRPGKDGRGWSATTGYCKGKDGRDLLVVFSSNAHPFPGPHVGKSCSLHDRFSAYSLLQHNGDFKAAANALRKLGYGIPANGQTTANANDTEGREKERDQAPVTPVLISLANVQARPVKWLWQGRIALGKLTLIAGDPGLGKSFLSLDFAARVSRGLPWPDAPHSSAPIGGVVLLSAEDDLEDTIRPRLDAADADVNRIIALAAVKHHYKEEPREVVFSLATDMPALEAAIQAVPDCKLVIIDPITAYLGGDTDSHNNGEIRGLLAPLAALAAKYGVALVLVTHLTKNPNVPAIYRSIGSIAFAAAARAVWGVKRDKENKRRRLFLPIKNNLAGDTLGMAYFLEPAANGVPIVGWEPEPIDLSADEADAEDDNDSDQAQEWLREALKDGPMPAQTVLDQGKANGFANKAVRQAFHDLRGKRKKSDFRGGWVWWLPSANEDIAHSTRESWEPSESSQKHGESSGAGENRDVQDFQVFCEDSQDAQDSEDEWGEVA